MSQNQSRTMYIESWLRGQISTQDLNDMLAKHLEQTKAQIPPLDSDIAIVKSNSLEKTIHDFFSGTE